MNSFSKITLILFCISILSCGKIKGPQKVEPQCIRDKIVLFEEDLPCETGASVQEYEFEGDLVYVFNQGDCGADFSREVLDYDCNTLGYLDGISGNDEINGKDFDKKASYVRTLFSN